MVRLTGTSSCPKTTSRTTWESVQLGDQPDPGLGGRGQPAPPGLFLGGNAWPVWSLGCGRPGKEQVSPPRVPVNLPEPAPLLRAPRPYVRPTCVEAVPTSNPLAS